MPRKSVTLGRSESPGNLSRRTGVAGEFGDRPIGGNLAFGNLGHYTLNIGKHLTARISARSSHSHTTQTVYP